MKVGTGIGIAALIIAIMGGLMPVVGLYVGWVALALACVAALFGDKGLTIATVIVSALVFIFLTPSLWVAEGVRAMAIGSGAPAEMTKRIGLPISLIMLAAPVVCIFLRSSGKLVLGAHGVKAQQ